MCRAEQLCLGGEAQAWHFACAVRGDVESIADLEEKVVMTKNSWNGVFMSRVEEIEIVEDAFGVEDSNELLSDFEGTFRRNVQIIRKRREHVRDHTNKCTLLPHGAELEVCARQTLIVGEDDEEEAEVDEPQLVEFGRENLGVKVKETGSFVDAPDGISTGSVNSSALGSREPEAFLIRFL